LMETARRHGVKKIVVVGTTCSYPKSAPLPFKEEHLWDGYPEPVTGPYGIAKRLIQLQGQLYRDQYGLNSVFLIPTNLYGPRDNFDETTSHVVPAIIKKIFDAQKTGDSHIVLWGDGTATREFLYVEDAAEMIVKAAELCNSSEPINLGTGIETPIRQIAELAGKLAGYQGAIVWDASKPNGQPRRVLDLTRARNHGLMHRHVSLLEGMARTVEWYQQKLEPVGTPSHSVMSP
jgi:GDP-L-fucose synthase